MREEPPRDPSAKPPPDLYRVWQVANDRAIRWKISEFDAREIADRVQDAVERGRKRKPMYVPDEGALCNFVEKAVRFHVINLVQRAKREISIDDVPERELVASGPGPAELLDDDPDPRVVYIAAVAETMPKRWREVWAMMLDNMKPREIAPVLGISVRTVNKYVEKVNRRMDEARVEWERLHPKETES